MRASSPNSSRSSQQRCFCPAGDACPCRGACHRLGRAYFEMCPMDGLQQVRPVLAYCTRLRGILSLRHANRLRCLAGAWSAVSRQARYGDYVHVLPDFRTRQRSGALAPPLRPRGITSALCLAHTHSLLAWASQVQECPLLRLRGIAPALLCTLASVFVLSLAISIMCLIRECRLLEIALLFHMRAFV